MKQDHVLPSVIPIFPLPGAFILHRAKVPLHIFEPRYLAMINDCMKTPERLIGLVQPDDAGGLYQTGGAGRLTSFSETEDGRYMITLTGTSRFRLETEVKHDKPYRSFNVDWQPFAMDQAEDNNELKFNRDHFIHLLGTYFESKGLAMDWEGIKYIEDELLINSISILSPFEPKEKQLLLEASDLSARYDTLIGLIELSLRNTNEVIQ